MAGPGISPLTTIDAVLSIPTIPGTPFEGGFYVDRITDNGATYALVAAPEMEAEGRVTWERAVELAAACRAGGHEDWTLPSRRDALAMAEKLLPTGSETPEIFREGGEQAFARTGYWTGTEVDGEPGCAWLQNFYYGYQTSDNKNFSYRVRAVRKVPL